MGSKPARNGEFVAQCCECNFVAYGSEAFCRRKGSHHARRHGHGITVGLGSVQ